MLFSRSTSPQLLISCAAILLLPGLPGALAGQIRAPSITASEAPEALYQRADSLFDTWETTASLELMETRLQRLPQDYEARWRASRAALVLGILETDEEAEVRWFERAGTHGDIAAELRPTGVDGLYWAALSRGRLALQHGPRTSTELAQQMWDLTERVLAIDSLHPGAHNILGKLNYEVEVLSRWERILGRLVLRKPFLSETSWEQALHHHRLAVREDPSVVLFQKDLGEALHRSGDSEAALTVLNAALELPPVWPVDDRFKEDIRRYIAEEIGG